MIPFTNSLFRLQKLYTNIDDVDLYVGGALEKPFSDAIIGPTFLCIVGNTFAK